MGKKEKLGVEHGGQRKEEGGGEGLGRHRRWVSEEHFTHEMKRCAEAEEVAERGCSKNSRHEGQKEEGCRRRTHEVQSRRSTPRRRTRWRSHRSLRQQLLHSPLRAVVVVVGFGGGGLDFIGGRFMAMEMGEF